MYQSKRSPKNLNFLCYPGFWNEKINKNGIFKIFINKFTDGDVCPRHDACLCPCPCHCLKSVRSFSEFFWVIRSFSGPYFPVFGLNTERYSESLHIQSEHRNMRTRITSNTDTFYTVYACFLSWNKSFFRLLLSTLIKLLGRRCRYQLQLYWWSRK